MPDEGEGYKVADESDGSDNEGQTRNEGGDQGAYDAGTEAEEKRDKAESSTDGVEDHDAGEALGGVFGGIANVGVVKVSHGFCWVVPNLSLGALVAIARREAIISLANELNCAVKVEVTERSGGLTVRSHDGHSSQRSRN